MTNKEIGRILQETGNLIELTGGNPFRARAFGSASRILQRADESAVALLADDRLTDIPGIGKGLVADIRTIVETGTLPARDQLLAALPPGLPEVLKIKGLGVKKVRALWTQLQITSLEELEQAAHHHRVAELDGFGAKTESTILENIARLREYNTQRRLADSWAMLHPFVEALAARPEVVAISPAGEIRRKLSVVSVANVVVSASNDQELLDYLGAPESKLMAEYPGSVWCGKLQDGFPVSVTLCRPEEFGTTLWRNTGPVEHIEAFEAKFGAPEPQEIEQDVYANAGLAYIEPELRDDSFFLQQAEESSIPTLLEVSDLQGSVHNHSTYSDGAHTLSQMADRCREMGLEYFGICDHSISLQVANGLSIERVKAQQEEIAELNDRYRTDGGKPFTIFSGIESDILADGSLDYPDEVLATFDLVVASVHSGFNMSIEAATNRLVTAIENPYTTILGHPTGRLLLVREGYPVDMETVIAACARHQVAIELNAHPYRLDLDWTWVRKATEAGVWISVNPDAHSIDQLNLVKWGVAAARKGGLTSSMCLNALSKDAFASWLESRRANREKP